jgi:anti-sigma B factor antagonist
MNDRSRCVEILSAGNVTILDLEGEIDIYSAVDFKEAMLQAIAGGAHDIVVDATKVTFMESSGLSVLIIGLRRLQPLAGTLTVVCGRRVDRLLEAAGLRNAFTLSATRDEALREMFLRTGSSGSASSTQS